MAEDHDGRPAAVLAIDGGNSKTDVALVADDGTLLASVRGPGASHEEFGLDEAMRRLDELVRLAGTRANGSAGGLVARHTSACLAGADLPEEEAALAAAIQGQGWSLTSAVANDTFAVLRAGLTPGDGERPWGIAVTCGAGINCVGVAPDGRTTRFLAFGTLSGDWGGGHGLGRETLWWAMRAEDGRGQPTDLRAAVATFYGLPSVHDVVVAFHLGHLSEDDLNGLPAVLFATATAGDAVARNLVERQAEEIATMAVTAMRRLDLHGRQDTPVVLGGGVLEARHPLLTDAITRRLAEVAPGSVPRIVDTPPVTGAALLGLDYLRRAFPEGECWLRLVTCRLGLPRAWLGADGRVPAGWVACGFLSLAGPGPAASCVPAQISTGFSPPPSPPAQRSPRLASPRRTAPHRTVAGGGDAGSGTRCRCRMLHRPAIPAAGTHFGHSDAGSGARFRPTITGYGCR